MNRSLVALSLIAVAAAFLASACGTALSTGVAQEAIVSRDLGCTGKVGVMAPYGGLNGKDSVQMNWARVALDEFNIEEGTSFSIVPANVESDPQDGVNEAHRLARDESIVGIVGPQTSGVAAAIGPIFDAAGLAFVSPSATRVALTNGSIRNFFRVVPNDGVQGPTDADFLADDLGAKRVFVYDNGEPYSLGLADSIIERLTERGVETKRFTVPMGQEDYSTWITQLDRSVDAVAVPFLEAADTQRFATQLRDNDKLQDFLATDSSFIHEEFHLRGAYVSSYATDPTQTVKGAQTMALYKSMFGSFDPFGAAANVAMTAVLTAAKKSCLEGTATRARVLDALPKVRFYSPLLDTNVRFNRKHEIVGGEFHIYMVDTEGYVAIK